MTQKKLFEALRGPSERQKRKLHSLERHRQNIEFYEQLMPGLKERASAFAEQSIKADYQYQATLTIRSLKWKNKTSELALKSLNDLRKAEVKLERSERLFAKHTESVGHLKGV